MRDIRHVFPDSLWHTGRSRAGVPINEGNIFVHGEPCLFVLQKGPRTCFTMEGAWDFIHLRGTTDRFPWDHDHIVEVRKQNSPTL